MAHSTAANLGLVSPIHNKHTLQIQTDIEKYIKAEAFLEQFRIRDFFEDYDKLRKGYVTEDKVNPACLTLVQVRAFATQTPLGGGTDLHPDQQVPDPKLRSDRLHNLLRQC